MEKKPCIRECVNKILSEMKIGEEISGWELHNRVAFINSDYEHTFPDTILRELRRHRDEVVCVKPQKSIYRKIK